MQVIWKNIKGYEGKYQVSNTGYVKNYITNRILKQGKEKHGYLMVTLYINGNSKSFKVHRLVAETFLPNPNNYPCINHKDEMRDNNNVDNLEWCTYKYNNNYGNAKIKKVEKRLKPINMYSINGELLKEYHSAIEAEREDGFNHRHISDCCIGKRKTHKGYIWRYKNADNISEI